MTYIYRCGAYVRVPIDPSQTNYEINSYDSSGNPIPLTDSEKESLQTEFIESQNASNPDGFQIIYYTFYLSETSFIDASIKAIDHLESEFGEDGFDIESISTMKDAQGKEIQLIESCNCPYCTYPEVSPDLRMEFNCPNQQCKKEIKVADSGWEAITCRWCNAEIERSHVHMGSDGKYFVEPEKPKKSSRKSKKSDQTSQTDQQDQ